MSVPKAMPACKPLRSRFIALVHRLVESLLGGVLPYLPPALEALMTPHADVTDMVDVLARLVKLGVRVKDTFGHVH